MHMADALLSPTVGTAMWGAAAGTIAYCSARVKKEMADRKTPLMGVLGAFLFAAQMINFTIPATGSSGHLGGGLLLTILLGPHAACLTLASVLVIQALFFADGGLLALGCNIFNLGVFPAFVAYPLIYRPLCGTNPSTGKMAAAAVAAAIAGLQLGAFAVVLETVISGISALPFSAFVSVMQPIHLGIGLVEGVATAIIVGFVHKARPDIFIDNSRVRHGFMGSIVPAFLALALVTGGFISWFSSAKPDGLQWSLNKVTGKEELARANDRLHSRLAVLQDKLAVLPDYNFKNPAGAATVAGTGDRQEARRSGTSLSGIVGALLTLGLTLLIGFILRKRQQLAAARPHSHEHAHPHRHEHEHLHSHGDTCHSHRHSHEHSHPHRHVHDHSEPHQADPNPQHTHETRVAEHSHGHADDEHGSHEHHHDAHQH